MNAMVTIVICLFLALAQTAMGQTVTGALSGKVTSASGAPVPNAAVTVTNVNTGQSRKALTAADGSFSITGLPTGTYRVEVESAGYKRAARENVQLTAGPINLTLEAGGTTGTVEVKGEAAVVQAESGEVSRSYDTKTLRELPVQDRNHQQLIELMPGVTPVRPTESIHFDPQRSRIWETNGQSSATNYRRWDGVENNEPFMGVAVHVPTVESLQQMNIATSNYGAELGRAGGAVVNNATRPGTNSFHGSLFEFHTNDHLRARNFFNPVPDPKAHFVSNEFGGSAGGPIVPNKTFWFASYEGDYLRQTRPTFTTVPTADFRLGNFSAVPGLTLYNPNTGNPNGAGRTPFTNNMIPPTQISPVAQSILAYIPPPNRPGFENNYFANVPFRNDGHRVDARLDHNFTDRTGMFLRWGYSNYYAVDQAALGALIGAGEQTRLRAHNAVANVSHNFGPDLLMEARFNYNRYFDASHAYDRFGTLSAASLGFRDLSGANLSVPRINIAGMEPIGPAPNLPARNVDNTFNWVNAWSARWGRNALQFGVDIWHIRMDGWQDLQFGPNGGFLFSPGVTSAPGAALGPFGTFANSFAGFLLGAPSVIGRTAPGIRPSYRMTADSAYIEDTIQLTPALHLNLGVRWDMFQPLEPAHSGIASIYNPLTNMFEPVGIGSVDIRSNRSTNLRNFGPRFGFAYKLTEKTVVRGGYGLSYWMGPLNFSAGSLIFGIPTVERGVVDTFSVAGPFNQLPVASSAVLSGPAPNQAVIFSPTTMPTPYVQSYSFMIQRDLGNATVFDIAYAGNVGRHLPYSRELNAALPGTGVAGLPFNQMFGRTASTIERLNGLTSNYNSLQVNLSKRFARGLAFAAAYTFGKALDYGGGLTPLLNNVNVRANYGPADWDRTHIFSFSHIWNLPFGAGTNHLNRGIVGQVIGNWQLAGILTAASGTPLTVTADSARCACPGNQLPAELVQTGTATGLTTFFSPFGFWYAVPYQFPTFAFAAPPAGQFGNLGRNSVRGPRFANYDLSLFRSFPIGEQYKIEFRGEAYNLTNTPHFANPVSNINSANFGQSLRTLPGLGERTIQLALRLVF